MSKNQSVSDVNYTCTDKCYYNVHGNFITSVITRNRPALSDFQLACFIQNVCKNYAKVFDCDGRTALHMAASCGRRELCYWLLKVGQAVLHTKDKESGYTSLHRSILYGQIDNAVMLIEMGAPLQAMDNEDLQPLDLALRDRLFKEFSPNNLCQVYVWGRNNNYTLGLGSQDSKVNPELVDFFRKNNISIKQAATDKFHSVFVSAGGRAWACGHGQGGRLGVDSEATVLKPCLLRTGTELVVSAAVSCDHTLLLMDSGQVWSCGSNCHHVLGHNPPPPCLLSPRPVKVEWGQLVGVAAARYSSVAWTRTSVYTFGLNAGQLGHPLTLGKTIITPKQVSGLNVKCQITQVAACVGATVVVISRGDIYLLHNYQIRRIASKMLGVTTVSVFGGLLNAEVDQKLSAKGGRELQVMVLTSSGKVLLWQDSFPQFTRCIYQSKRSLTFYRLQLSLSGVALVTREGEVYTGQVKLRARGKAIAAKSKEQHGSFHDFIDKLDCHQLNISKVVHIHRAVDVTADPKGHNFIVIQEHPSANLTDIPLVGDSEFDCQMASLLNTAHEEDALHDVLIQVDHYSVAAHHFVLATVSEEFATMTRGSPVTVVDLAGVHVQVLNQVLRFAYTHCCQLTQPGPMHLPAFEGDVIKAAFELAKRWKMSDLIKALSILRYEEGFIIMKEGVSTPSLARVQRCWQRTMLPTLHNVTVKSCDGASFKAHKCVLAARLEYFNNMFTGGWMEAEVTNNLSLTIPQVVLAEVLNFLYTDEAPSLINSQDPDFISSVLVVADQMFIKRLKEICEVALSGTLSLRNAAYLLQLAVTYNTLQLKNCCMQFISLNLVPVIESRTLEILDSNCLQELSTYYRDMIPAVGARRLTPFSTVLADDEVIAIANSHPVKWFTSTEDIINYDSLLPTELNKSAVMPMISKKLPRVRKISENQRKRVKSNSSCSELDSNMDVIPSQMTIHGDLVEQIPENEWVLVDKTPKVVQERLRAIVKAPTILPVADSFTTLRLEDASPPIQDNINFPQLLSTPPRPSFSPKISIVEVKRSAVVKLSQKQRKKLLADGEGMEVASDPPPVQSPWAAINNTVYTPWMSPQHSEKGDQVQARFCDVVAEEKEQRVNLTKMKSKSLQLTQVEDKAMEELLSFYNAANMYDERITVERVLSANIAKPTWITSRNQ